MLTINQEQPIPPREQQAEIVKIVDIAATHPDKTFKVLGGAFELDREDVDYIGISVGVLLTALSPARRTSDEL